MLLQPCLFHEKTELHSLAPEAVFHVPRNRDGIGPDIQLILVVVSIFWGNHGVVSPTLRTADYERRFHLDWLLL